MGLVFEPDLDVLRDLCRGCVEVLAVIVVNVRIRRHPDRVDNPVDDALAPGFQVLFRP